MIETAERATDALIGTIHSPETCLMNAASSFSIVCAGWGSALRSLRWARALAASWLDVESSSILERRSPWKRLMDEHMLEEVDLRGSERSRRRNWILQPHQIP